MPFLRNALKSGIALQVMRFAQRELSKPENQRKLKALAQRAVASRRRAGA